MVALDVGEKRVGVAVASLSARLPRPHGVLEQAPDIIGRLQALLEQQQAAGLVIGLPRGLNGQDTPQTAYVRDFIARLEATLPIPVYWIDEALTSTLAEAELGKRGGAHTKGDVDALAACYILDDFLATYKETPSK